MKVILINVKVNVLRSISSLKEIPKVWDVQTFVYGFTKHIFTRVLLGIHYLLFMKCSNLMNYFVPIKNFQSVHKCHIVTEPLSAIDFQFLKRLSECRRVISHGLPNTSYLNHINIAYIVCVGLGL